MKLSMAEEKIIFKRPRFRRKLYVSKKPYLLRKGQCEGEKELSDLVLKAKRESIWIYSHNNETWYNITKKNGAVTKRDGTKQLSARAHSVSLSQVGKNVTHYHIHPQFVEKIETEKIREKIVGIHPLYHTLPEPESKMIHNAFRNTTAVRISIPSVGDIREYAAVTELNKDCNLDFRIVSPHGIIIAAIYGNTENPDEFAEEYKKAFTKIVRPYPYLDTKKSIDTAVEEINEIMIDKLILDMEHKH
jgi:hypothetical protein